MTAPKKPIPPLTDAEEAEIQREIAADPDTEEVTAEWMAKATTFAEAFPEWADAFRRGEVQIVGDPRHPLKPKG